VSIPARVAPVGLSVTRESHRPTRYAGRQPIQPARLRECLANELFATTAENLMDHVVALPEDLDAWIEERA
jgi:hypothetical protein